MASYFLDDTRLIELDGILIDTARNRCCMGKNDGWSGTEASVYCPKSVLIWQQMQCDRFQVLNNAFISESGKKQVAECVVGDSTASILLKARGKECEEITSGRSLEITGCKVDMYHGSMRLICDLEATKITEIDAVSPNVRFCTFTALLIALDHAR